MKNIYKMPTVKEHTDIKIVCTRNNAGKESTEIRSGVKGWKGIIFCEWEDEQEMTVNGSIRQLLKRK